MSAEQHTVIAFSNPADADCGGGLLYVAEGERLARLWVEGRPPPAPLSRAKLNKLHLAKKVSLLCEPHPCELGSHGSGFYISDQLSELLEVSPRTCFSRGLSLVRLQRFDKYCLIGPDKRVTDQRHQWAATLVDIAMERAQTHFQSAEPPASGLDHFEQPARRALECAGKHAPPKVIGEAISLVVMSLLEKNRHAAAMTLVRLYYRHQADMIDFIFDYARATKRRLGPDQDSATPMHPTWAQRPQSATDQQLSHAYQAMFDSKTKTG